MCTGTVWTLSLTLYPGSKTCTSEPIGWFRYFPIPADGFDCTGSKANIFNQCPGMPENHCGECPVAMVTGGPPYINYTPPAGCIDTFCCKEGVCIALAAAFNSIIDCACLGGQTVFMGYDSSVGYWWGDTLVNCPGGAYLHAAFRAVHYPICFQFTFGCNNVKHWSKYNWDHPNNVFNFACWRDPIFNGPGSWNFLNLDATGPDSSLSSCCNGSVNALVSSLK
jgi:hypothetical protein